MWPENVRKSDLHIQYYRGSGPGGQHRNKKDTACRITHKPTGISATAEDSKSQDTNRKNAFKKLTKKLVPLMTKIPNTHKRNYKANTKIIRTYHEKRQTVKDIRIDKVFRYDDILEGKLDDLIKELKSE